MIDEFAAYLETTGKSENTIHSYLLHVAQFLRWHQETFGSELKEMKHIIVLEYRSYLQNSKKQKAVTINAKLSALVCFNEFLIIENYQTEFAVTKKDLLKRQSAYASPSELTENEVNAFRQKVLITSGLRDYVLVTILAYAGLRISEALALTVRDVDLIGREITVNKGKGNKERIVFIGDKIVNAVKEYLAERGTEDGYLFSSQRSETLDRSAANKLCKRCSEKITPHMLRHFYCSNALEKGYSYHEVANQAGHANISTTLRYTNPTKEKMKDKADKL